MEAEYDLWKLLGEIKDEILAEVEATWIKGHQGEDSHRNKTHGPFTRPVDLNIDMDRAAYELEMIIKSYPPKEEHMIKQVLGFMMK